jgi:imidazolonepropionase
MPATAAIDLLIHPIGELATTSIDGGAAHGADMRKVERIANAALAVSGDRIVAAGSADKVLSEINATDSTVVIDATNKLVTAGFVDPHTHLIFSGNRANEFVMRCQGKSYAEIAAAGGGIVASMSATRNATIEELVARGLKRLNSMMRTGTTTCEVKTGYGLDTESELRMLEAILTLQHIQPVDLVPTFMPAHAFPPGADKDVYVREIVETMLPRAAKLAAASGNGNGARLYADVFCDQGYFSLDQTREILSAAMKLGCTPKVHADEFVNLGATALAVELKAASADHLLNVSDSEIDLLAASETVAVLLPGTSFFLNLAEHAPARKMIDRGVAVALGTDFNPGSCHISSIPMIWGLACLHLHMTVEEALTAVTYNAACAVGLKDRVGQLRAGWQADFLIYDVATLEEVPYNLGSNPVAAVFKAGKIVHKRGGE